MMSKLSRAINSLDFGRGSLGQITKLFGKMDVISKLPWKPAVAVVAVGFTGATFLSVWLGQIILDHSTQPRALQGPPAEPIHGTDPSIPRAAINQIVTRNIFNSDGKTGEDTPEESQGTKKPQHDIAVKTNLPIRVLGIIYGGDPFSGIAVVEDTSKQSVNSFMCHDTIAKGSTVLEIQEDRIIIDHDGSKEFAELYQVEPKKLRRKKTAPKPTKDAGSELSPLATNPPPSTFKEEGFERDKGKIVMSQDFKQRMLTGDFAKVLQDAKAEPNLVDGELRGFKLTRIRQDSIYEKSGLQNDDIITEINGTALTDTGQAIKTLQGLRNESELEIRVNRGGNMMTVNIEIR
jgi:type II secretion system protein C